MDETTGLGKHYARRKFVYDVVDLELEEAYSLHAIEGAKHDGEVELWKNDNFLHGQLKSIGSQVESGVPRCLDTNPLGSALVFSLDSKVKETLIPLRLVGSFFEFIPARLGRNAALDEAVSCLCAIYSGTPSVPYTQNRGIHQSYARALSSLRGSLSDDSLRMQSETLCASILLQLCEVSQLIDDSRLRLDVDYHQAHSQRW